MLFDEVASELFWFWRFVFRKNARKILQFILILCTYRLLSEYKMGLSPGMGKFRKI
jgi:hypothetical protein